MGSPIELVGFVVGALFLGWALRTGRRLWWTPRNLEKEIRASGIDGTSYSLRFHDIWEMIRLRNEASAKPMSLSHDIASRALPCQLQLAKTYGLCLSHYRFIYLSLYLSLDISIYLSTYLSRHRSYYFVLFILISVLLSDVLV